jgi:flagellar hook-basal body complex protein FliE
MTAIPAIVTPSAVAEAYARVGGDAASGGTDFAAVLSNSLQGAVRSGHAAENQAMQAVAGDGNLTELVTALSRAELTLQTATAVRDRVVQAYQDIMKMPI